MIRGLQTATLAIIAVTSVASWAGKHPVPLDPKVEATKCLECHEDKTKGKSVHSAMATGCLSCHEVRVNKDITRTKLTTTTPVALCVTCHADKKAADIAGKVHSPAVRDCLKCHDPHTAENKNQLLKATSGASKDDNLCLSCHRTGTNVPKDGSRHAALDMGCDTCHVSHKSGDPAKREFSFHLTKDAPQLCLDCHDVKDESLQKAHAGQPFSTADCLQCHDPHQSNRPKLMQAFVHAPFEGGKDSCSTCHQAPNDGKITLTQASAKELCVSCHSEKTEQIEKAKVQHPGAAGDCTDCHNPHAGRSPGFPKPDAVNVCLTCHADQAEQHKKRVLHQPAFEQGCATCHEPHGGDNPRLLRAQNTNALCLECHGSETQPAELKEAHALTIFGGKVKLPENYFAKVPVLPLKYGLGHPVDRHPVASVTNPLTKQTKELGCLTCHQPHAGQQDGMLVKDQASNMEFCKGCHTTLINVKQ